MRDSGFLELSLIFSNKSIEQNSENFQSLFIKGSINYLLKNYTDAIVDMNKSLEINPKQHEVYYQRGLIHEQLGANKKKIDDWKTASKMGNALAKIKLEKILN